MSFNDSPLRLKTPEAWVEVVMENFDCFLLDHAAAEKKASGMAVGLISHYPDRTRLVSEMADLAIEELCHYKEMIKVIHERGLVLSADEKDLYINRFRKAFRDGKDEYFIDRLIVAGIIEARGCERFGLVAEALEAGSLKQLYQAITKSEQRHYQQFINLAKHYFAEDIVEARADELLDIEATLVESLPIRPKLH